MGYLLSLLALMILLSLGCIETRFVMFYLYDVIGALLHNLGIIYDVISIGLLL